jgi:hypothetical protein
MRDTDEDDDPKRALTPEDREALSSPPPDDELFAAAAAGPWKAEVGARLTVLLPSSGGKYLSWPGRVSSVPRGKKAREAGFLEVRYENRISHEMHTDVLPPFDPTVKVGSRCPCYVRPAS